MSQQNINYITSPGHSHANDALKNSSGSNQFCQSSSSVGYNSDSDGFNSTGGGGLEEQEPYSDSKNLINQNEKIEFIYQPEQMLDQKIGIPISTVAGQSNNVQIQLVPHGTTSSGQQLFIVQPIPVQSNDRQKDLLDCLAEQQQQPGCSSSPVQFQFSGTSKHSPASSIIIATDDSMSPSNKKSRVLSAVEREAKLAQKRARQAEAARNRYHRLSEEEKKALNLKRTIAQKQKRQREREMAELEMILRTTNDIIEDPKVVVQLAEKEKRAKWAEAARNRYQKMSLEERKRYNSKRRSRQILNKVGDGEQCSVDAKIIQEKIREQNERKAEAARLRYHRMTPEEKKVYNQRRTEAFRRRRMEEEELLAMPIGRINGEALDRAQQIVVRNAKRAEAARLRYQRMTPEERREYNRKRYAPRRAKSRGQASESSNDHVVQEGLKVVKETSHERIQDETLDQIEFELTRRTYQARQHMLQQSSIFGTYSNSNPIITQPLIHQPIRVQQPGQSIIVSQSPHEKYVGAQYAVSSGVPAIPTNTKSTVSLSVKQKRTPSKITY